MLSHLPQFTYFRIVPFNGIFVVVLEVFSFQNRMQRLNTWCFWLQRIQAFWNVMLCCRLGGCRSSNGFGVFFFKGRCFWTSETQQMKALTFFRKAGNHQSIITPLLKCISAYSSEVPGSKVVSYISSFDWYLGDIRLSPRCGWDLWSSGLLRIERRFFFTDPWICNWRALREPW